MLSRTADHLFWLARYIERAENTARMLDVNLQAALLPQPAASAELLWRGVLGISELQHSFDARYSSLAPQNRARVEQALREELERAVRQGFSAAEVEAGRRAVLEARRLARTQDRSLAARLAGYSFARRTFAWDVALEERMARATAAEVNAVLRKYIDPSRLALVAAGDFRKSASSGGRGSPPAAAPGAAAEKPPAAPRPSAGSGG